MRIRISVSAGEEIRDLKKQIQFRTKYENLKNAITRRKNSHLDATPARNNFAAWKKANPDYPKVRVEALKKRLQSLLEKKNPALKTERKAKNAQYEQVRKQLIDAERELDRLRDRIAETKDKDHDFVPDDVENVEQYVMGLRKAALKKSTEVSSLRNKLKALK